MHKPMEELKSTGPVVGKAILPPNEIMKNYFLFFPYHKIQVIAMNNMLVHFHLLCTVFLIGLMFHPGQAAGMKQQSTSC